MRAILLATTVGAALSMAVTTKSKKPAVQALLESATSMLKNGATPEVVTFAQYTLQEVTGTVMPAIISESENDQNFIYDLHARFGQIHSALDSGNAEIAALNTQEKNQAAAHRTCREAEYADCDGECAVEGCGIDFNPAALTECEKLHEPNHHFDNDLGTAAGYAEGKRKCEQRLHDLWAGWVTAEGDLRTYHDLIHDHFCPTSNGTTKVFRDEASGWMQHYMAKKVLVDEALEDYDMKALCCEVSHGKLDEQSDRCNQIQTDLESTACTHAGKIHSVLTTYYRDYGQAKSSYSCAVEEVMQLETDRHREWVTLEVVRCLLDKIEEQNGRPCEESTGGVAEVLANCEAKHGIERDRKICEVTDADITEKGMDDVDWDAEDVRKLCINYPELPQHPPACADRDSVGQSRCLPQPIETCSDRSTWHHFANLPGFPQPHFSKENPGCNAYPECVPCPQPLPPTPEQYELDSCPGYTLDGCPTADDAITYIRSVEGKADVRCCGVPDSDAKGAKNGCQAQDFVPVGDHVPVTFTVGEYVHTKCYFDVTYQTALEVCHAVGLQICTVEQIKDQDCCNTGCHHDGHHIWVARGGTAVAASDRAAEVMGGAYDTYVATGDIEERRAGQNADGEKVEYHTHAENTERRGYRDGTLRDFDGSHNEDFEEIRCQEGMPNYPACLDDSNRASTTTAGPDWKDPSNHDPEGGYEAPPESEED